MDIELLDEGELMVELEVRGLLGLESRVVTLEHKRALIEMLQEERLGWLDTPSDPHEAARRQPVRELAACEWKTQKIQQLLLQGIREGVAIAEMYSPAITKLKHIQDRIYRSRTCPVFLRISARLSKITSMIRNLVIDMKTRAVSSLNVIHVLSRLVVRTDPAVIDELIEKAVEDWERLRQEEIEGMKAMEEVERLERERIRKEQECREVVPIVSSELKVEDLSEVSEDDKIRIDKDQETGVEGVKPQESGEEENDTRFEDLQEQVDDEGAIGSVQFDQVIISHTTESRQDVGGIPVQDVDHSLPKSMGGACTSIKESWVTSVELPIQIQCKDKRYIRHSYARRKAKTRYQMKGIRSLSIVAKGQLWHQLSVVRHRLPVDHLTRVLDLRLQDEVLAKANRKIGCENA